MYFPKILWYPLLKLGVIIMNAESENSQNNKAIMF